MNCALGTENAEWRLLPPAIISAASITCWTMLVLAREGGPNSRAVNVIWCEFWPGVSKLMKTLTKFFSTTIRFGDGRTVGLIDRHYGSGGNNHRSSRHALEMFNDLLHCGSFTPVLAPTLLDQFPRASTKTNFIRFFWLARFFTLHDAQDYFCLTTSLLPEWRAPGEYFIDHNSESIDVSLLGNSAVPEAEFPGVV